MTRRSKKATNMVIRKTVNLTDSMRKEREKETFEEMNTATSKSKETTSVESMRSKKNKKLPIDRSIKIQKERIVRYEADLVSGYEKTCDTHSMDTLLEPDNIEAFEKKCEEPRFIGPQLIPIKYVTTDIETPVQAVFVSDYDLCDVMHRPKPNSTQTKEVKYLKRFEVEQKFLEELVIDIEKLLVSSGRMDVELKVVKTRETNGTPRAKISLIRKMKCQKVTENLTNQRELYGFTPSEIPMKDDEFEKGHVGKEEITKKTMTSSSGIQNRFKRLFGY